MQRSQAILPEIHICLAGLPGKNRKMRIGRDFGKSIRNIAILLPLLLGSPVRKRQEGYGEGKDGIRDL